MRITGGELRGRTLEGPGRLVVRPTTDKVRQAVFNRLAGQVAGAHFVDLFAGMGVVGLEALSRGASHVTWVEGNPKVYRILAKNVNSLTSEEGMTLVCSKVIPFLKKVEAPVADLVWADPPYALDPLPILAAIIVSGIMRDAGWILIEHESRTALPAGIEGWALIDERRYGDTAIGTYARFVDQGPAKS